jgi:hypothetical protein
MQANCNITEIGKLQLAPSLFPKCVEVSCDKLRIDCNILSNTFFLKFCVCSVYVSLTNTDDTLFEPIRYGHLYKWHKRYDREILTSANEMYLYALYDSKNSNV